MMPPRFSLRVITVPHGSAGLLWDGPAGAQL